MNSTPPNSRRAPALRTARRSKPYAPPKPGPGYNERLAQDILKRYRGDSRFQVAIFCKHLNWGDLEESGSPSERRLRFEMGEVLQLCVTHLVSSSGIRLQNLSELSQKHVLMLVRYWQRRSDPDGLIGRRVAMIRKCFSLLNKHAPLLAASALNLQPVASDEKSENNASEAANKGVCAG